MSNNIAVTITPNPIIAVTMIDSGPQGVPGIAGPSNITIATNTNGTGFVKGNGTSITFDSKIYQEHTVALDNVLGTNTGDSSGHTALIPYTGATGNVNLGANNLTVDTSTLFVDATTKKVGIGTTTPAQKLDVSGNININTNGTNVLISSYKGADSVGNNIFIGGGGQSSVGESGATYKGSHNTAQGADVLYSNTTGYYNSAQGMNALRYNTTGGYNSAQGALALYSNTTGDFNSAQGVSALSANTTGAYNSAQGAYALRYNTTGAYNSAQGMNALSANTTGDYNSAQGMNAGRSITTGNNNTFVGYGAGYHASQLISAVNSMALGNGAYTTADNQVVIGNASVAQTLLNGKVGIGTTSPTAVLNIKAGTATAGTAPIKLTSGTLNTVSEAGAIEFDGTDYYLNY